MSKAAIEEVLGAEEVRMDDGDGGVAYVYPLAWESVARQSDMLAYVVVAYSDGLAHVVQMSGSPPTGNYWRFSSVRLGDSEQVVFDIFGAPFSQEYVEFNGAQLWQYGIWPFSFEIKDRRVISVRLEE